MTAELEDRLRRDLVAVQNDGAPGIDAVARLGHHLLRRRRRRTASLVGAASVFVVTGAVIALARHDPASVASGPAPTGSVTASTSPDHTDAPTTTARAPVAVASPWSALPPDPRGVRRNVSAVWTGTRAIAWGGVDDGGVVHGDAAAYDPMSGSWRTIADFPGDTRLEPIVAWLGDRMIVLGGTDPGATSWRDDGATYDPTTDGWTVIAAPPAAVLRTGLTGRVAHVWTGAELIVWGGVDEIGASSASGAAYDPAGDTWRLIADAPIPPRERAAVVWSGTEMIVWGGADGDGTELADGAAYDPVTDSWRTIAASPLAPRVVDGYWTGSEVLVAVGSSSDFGLAHTDGALYDPSTDTWRTIASGLGHPGFAGVWTGDQLLLFAKGGAVVFDLDANRWIAADLGGAYDQDATPIWTGSRALLLGTPYTVDDPTAPGGTSFDPSMVGG